ncbi:hypothetical protein N7495_004860 [Penicillium taxi]|uniref:uncharacterized protein n=1 Tax=Penicillium taxi TaxID=168475 RepID=UPI0025454F38|nr:uncharacterized protein N7495_004860 [Penicillium taxi]KAJ5900116.1 hypothetical protein N7495_004860 [Penicillium taxi]
MRPTKHPIGVSKVNPPGGLKNCQRHKKRLTRSLLRMQIVVIIAFLNKKIITTIVMRVGKEALGMFPTIRA